VTRQLESEICRFYGATAAVASSSGTAAVHVALAALGLDPRDEVITTPITDMGTVIPILACNCIPVFADVSPETGNLTADTIAEKITQRTRAVIVVHLFGRPVDLSPVVDLVRRHGLALIEDCAQAHGAEYGGRKVGTFGDLGCFSLQQSKQISCGDGGFTLVNRRDLEERARLFVDKGWMRHGEARGHRFLGMNYRITELQAAVAVAQMRKLPRLLASRRASALELTRQLRETPGIVLPADDPSAVSSWWKVAVGIDDAAVGSSAADVLDALIVEGVKATRPYRPRPLFAEEMLRDQRTYGNSRFPFTEGDYQAPRIDDFPGVLEFDRKWLLISWGNRVPRSCVDGIAKAFRKVMGALS
jgi:dTDP-4-amino-4,6-dideoxygalactose transaminase